MKAGSGTVASVENPAAPARSCRHIVTCEYPPSLGGVSDYTRAIARELALHRDEVHVWAPGDSGVEAGSADVTIHRTLGGFEPWHLLRCGRELNRFTAPRRILVQWVPHGYGYRSMNLALCVWLWVRSVFSRDCIEVMVHEPHLGFGEGSWQQNVAAAIHRVMDLVLLRAAKRVFISTPLWEPELRPYAPRGLQFEWLPVPTNIRVNPKPDVIEAVRREYLQGGGVLLGHFGTHNPLVTGMLEAVLPGVARRNANCNFLLMGAGSAKFRERLLHRHPDLHGRVHATGSISGDLISSHIAACDLMLQPYPDGVSTRRTTTMAALVHGCPVVTTTGLSTEPVWLTSSGVALAPASDCDALVEAVSQLCSNSDLRRDLGARGKALYAARFDIAHIIDQIAGRPTAEGVTK